MQLSQVLLVSLLPQIQAAETILGAYIFHRHGDRTTKSYPPTSLTPLGYQQVYQSGEFYRTRYVSNGSTQIFGISTDVVKNSQLSVQTAVDTVLQNSATGFLQGLYPPVGVTLGSQTLANGTSVEEPLGGYQLIPVSVLASESSIANSGDSQWLEGNSGCQNAIVSSNEYFFTSDYLDLLSSTGAFYQGILSVINTTFTSATDTYKNAYASKFSQYCGVWPIKCRQGSKTNKSNYQFWKKLTFDWLVESPNRDLFGQRPQYPPNVLGDINFT
jgi:hypothetical protein